MEPSLLLICVVLVVIVLATAALIARARRQKTAAPASFTGAAESPAGGEVDGRYVFAEDEDDGPAPVLDVISGSVPA